MLSLRFSEFRDTPIELYELGQVCKFRGGTPLTQKDVIPGDVPVIASSQKPSFYHNIANRTEETIVMATDGVYAGFVSFWNIPVFLYKSFSVHPDNKLFRIKYVYYFLKSIQKKIYAMQQGGVIPHISGSSIAKFKIPVPPLDEQEKIIAILDLLTRLESVMEEEVKVRQRQCKYYRNKLNKLFDIKEETIVKTLGELGEFVRRNGLTKKI